ncbi:MAG: hypothetical protein ACRYHQ_10270 [Janthinobacterium lividum]
MRRAHPDWAIFAVLVDEPPDEADTGLLSATFDGIMRIHELGIPRHRSWLFKHDIVEACTAVKGHALLRLLETHDKVVYFDPDIALFHPLDDLEALLDHASVVLTPHQTSPNLAAPAVLDNELTSLQYGVYNLGFLAVRADAAGTTFARWWATQLYRACYDEVERGIFTDQKYCDLVPALFERVHIHRDPGYNVASWNIGCRTVRINHGGNIEVDGGPLRFYHFTKIGSAGDVMTERYALDNSAIFEIWEWYRRELAANTVAWVPKGYWGFGRFSNGLTIPKPARVVYRRRPDLLAAFADPFDAGAGGFLQWLRHEQPALLEDAIS